MFWNRFRKQEQPAIVQPVKPEYLRPGECECGHYRCSHVDGKGQCKAGFPPEEDNNHQWSDCACQIYIRDDDNDSDAPPETPTPSELEKLYQL